MPWYIGIACMQARRLGLLRGAIAPLDRVKKCEILKKMATIQRILLLRPPSGS